MATATVQPDSITAVNYDSWTRTGGSTKYGVVTDASDGTYLTATGTAEVRQGFFWEGISGAAEITTFDFNARGLNNSAFHPVGIYYRYAAANTDSAGNFANFSTSVWEDKTMTDPVTPPSVAVFNAAEWGFIRRATGDANAVSITLTSMDVTYTPDAGGFAYLIGCVLPPLVAAASHGLSFMDIRSITAGLKLRPSSVEELSALMAAFKRRPVYGY